MLLNVVLEPIAYPAYLLAMYFRVISFQIDPFICKANNIGMTNV